MKLTMILLGIFSGRQWRTMLALVLRSENIHVPTSLFKGRSLRIQCILLYCIAIMIDKIMLSTSWELQ